MSVITYIGLVAAAVGGFVVGLLVMVWSHRRTWLKLDRTRGALAVAEFDRDMAQLELDQQLHNCHRHHIVGAP